LPNPTADLYARIDFPHILFHLEKLRTRYITQRYETNHSLLLNTMHQDAQYDLQDPTLLDNPLSPLISILIHTQNPNRPNIPHLTAFSHPHTLDHITPSNAH